MSSKETLPTIMVFHDSDQDGYCAGNIVHYNKKSPSNRVITMAVTHGVNFNLIKVPEETTQVFICDLVAPLTFVTNLCDLGIKVTVIDHHDTSIRVFGDFEYEGLTKVLGKEMSACGLAWTHFSPNAPMPWAVKMINNWDIWDHEDPQVLPFHYGMECLDFKERKLWTTLFKGDPNSCTQIMQMGSTVAMYWLSEMNKVSNEKSWTIERDGLKYLVVNGWFTNSYEFAQTFNHDSYDAIMWFRFNPNYVDTPWQVSFRSDKEGIDLTGYAEQHGGGGHAGSCGCFLTSKEIEEWFPTEPKEFNMEHNDTQMDVPVAPVVDETSSDMTPEEAEKLAEEVAKTVAEGMPNAKVATINSASDLEKMIAEVVETPNVQ